MIRHYELVERVKAYDPNVDEKALNRAYVFAMKAHGSQKRHSGDPYFSHPVEVAGIISDMRLDCATIITALLHDTVEDTSVTLEDIREQFGETVATLVDGVTKLSRIKFQSPSTRQAENFRKLLLAMSNDVRVLLVKLADRLHNMRTLHYITDEKKRKRIAKETLDIYVPLAERIGMHHLKDELEDLAFQVLEPGVRESLISRLKFLRQEGGGKNLVEKIIRELNTLLKEEKVKAEVVGRIKKPYSIWQKMRRRDIGLEQLSDIMAFRVLVNKKDECYKVLGIFHGAYRSIPGRLKDYISTPKPNNYQSIHTAVNGPMNHRIEIQIRTKEMNQVAEYGVAAHWQYKQGETKDLGKYKGLRSLLESLLEIYDNTPNPEDFLKTTKIRMFQDQVFCFTPTGDLITLPRMATPIDFAYAIHSDIGNHCFAAKINGRMAPLKSILQNGDQVEITTSKQHSPSPMWENVVVTEKARANIRKFIRTQKRDKYIQVGRAILKKAFKQENLTFSDKKLEPILERFNAHTPDDLYAIVGEGQHNSHDVIRALHPERQTLQPVLEPTLPAFPEKKEAAFSIRGLIPGMPVHYARCCHPLPGDKIVGLVVTGKGITIHTYDCGNMDKFKEEPERWLDLSWAHPKEQEEMFIGRLNLTLLNEPGSIATLTKILGLNGANIFNLKFTNRTENFSEILIDIEVKDTDHLGNILAALRASTLVHSAERAKG